MTLKKLGKRHDNTWKRTGKDLKMTWKKTSKMDLNCFGKNLKKKKIWKRSWKSLKKNLERTKKKTWKDLEKDFICVKTVAKKRPGKTWKITLPNKYIKIADSNSFYVQ